MVFFLIETNPFPFSLYFSTLTTFTNAYSSYSNPESLVDHDPSQTCHTPNVQEFKNKNNYNNFYNQITNDDSSSTLTLFYSHECGNSVDFAPYYNQFAAIYNSDTESIKEKKLANLNIAAVDCAWKSDKRPDVYNDICNKLRIRKYPTVVLLNGSDKWADMIKKIELSNNGKKYRRSAGLDYREMIKERKYDEFKYNVMKPLQTMVRKFPATRRRLAQQQRDQQEQQRQREIERQRAQEEQQRIERERQRQEQERARREQEERLRQEQERAQRERERQQKIEEQTRRKIRMAKRKMSSPSSKGKSYEEQFSKKTSRPGQKWRHGRRRPYNSRKSPRSQIERSSSRASSNGSNGSNSSNYKAKSIGNYIYNPKNKEEDRAFTDYIYKLGIKYPNEYADIYYAVAGSNEQSEKHLKKMEQADFERFYDKWSSWRSGRYGRRY